MNSRQGDQNPVETRFDLMSGTTPTPALSYYRFPFDLWDRAGYSLEALPTNRLGSLAVEQDHLVTEGWLGLWLSGLFAFGLVLFGLVGLNNPTKRVGSIVLGLLGLFLLMLCARSLLWRVRDLSEGRADSFCSELTKWKETDGEGDPFYGLRQGSFEARLSSKAYATLPKTAHYRIYFSPRTHQVVNVEEHADNGPHEVPSPASARLKLSNQ
jgi:hypothetical protein